MDRYSTITLAFFLGLLGTPSALPQTYQPSERDAIQFERAKRAKAEAQAQKEAGRPKLAAKVAERPATEKKPAAGASELAAIKFERAKLAAAEAQTRKDAAQAKTERPATERPAVAGNRPRSGR